MRSRRLPRPARAFAAVVVVALSALATDGAIGVPVAASTGASAAPAQEKALLPKGASWVVDPIDVDEIVRALSAPSSAENGPAHQLAIHAVVLTPALRDPVLAAIENAKRRTLVQSELDAAIKLRRITKAQPKLPAWRITAPAPESTLRKAYEDAQAATGIRWQYLAAINFVETKFGRIRGTSTAGAQGPMQFLPSTWKLYGKGGDINNDRDAIAAAARFLKAKGAPGDMRKALFRYNNSTRYVDAVETYANNMLADPALFGDYHAWNVIYRWAEGDVYLLPGYVGAG